MTNINGTSYQTSPVQPNGNQPVSPFDRSSSASQMPPSPFQNDGVQTNGQQRGAVPITMDIFREQQSAVSPFHRPDGQSVDQIALLNASTQTPDQTLTPMEQAPPDTNSPLVFVYPKELPEGPAIQNIEQLVQQETQMVQAPQQAIQLVVHHVETAKSEREWANRITWGAKFHAVQAAEMAEQALAQRDKMSAEQLQAVKSKIVEHRNEAIGLLNEAKKHAINTYNESLKAGLIYNHFFTAAGTFIEQLDAQTRTAVKAQIDEGFSRWNGTFPKEWEGQMVQADGAMTLIDKTSAEVAENLHRMNSILSQI